MTKCKTGLEIGHESMLQYYWEDVFDRKEKSIETVIGHVTHYFNNINVAVLTIKDEVKTGDMIHILGRSTGFTQKVTSMQIEHKNVDSVKPGEYFAIKVIKPVCEHNILYKITEETA